MVDLHPAVAHHVVNTLGWPALRPLQNAAAPVVRSGDHALLLAATAGGKTEAAVFPLLSRMLDEDWRGLSVLYLCPLRALLNNLHPRLARYADLVGRRAGLWHGDVAEADREAIRDDPPDVLLTTPESIEAMLVSSKTDHAWLFRDLRTIVVDEIHAFAGDDRGWHLLAVVERVQRLAGRELQRVGLSATVGNPDELLAWLTRTCAGPRHVIQPPQESRAAAAALTVDHVGTLENAAIVISRLHRGEKRLVFVDSRARAEELTVRLRERDVTTFVSHSSLGREQRRQAEEAFAEARNCVIVATSTLELGVDVGDLDRVIQIDSPPTVASFLQRLGRTGRRPGAERNLLFLATREMSLPVMLGLLASYEDGYVEPLTPPALPAHLVAQQLLALTLQEGAVGRATWPEWLGDPNVLGPDVAALLPVVTAHLVEHGHVHVDQGLLSMGREGEQQFGRRHFLELLSAFTAAPMFRVLAGRAEIGSLPVEQILFEGDDAHLVLLAGRSWAIRDVDWRRMTVRVEPAEQRGRTQWFSDGGGLVSYRLAQSVRDVLAGRDVTVATLGRRATRQLRRLRQEFPWLGAERDTVIVRRRDGDVRWWTFGGTLVNAWLQARLGDLAGGVHVDPYAIKLKPHGGGDGVRDRLADVGSGRVELPERLLDRAADRLKFSRVLPRAVSRAVAERRLRAEPGDLETTAGIRMREWNQQPVEGESAGFRWLRDEQPDEVPSGDLRASDVPLPPASTEDERAIQSMVEFAHTFDGYAWGGPPGELGPVVHGVRRTWDAGADLPDDLDTLRACLFFSVRADRFSGGYGPNDEDVVWLQALLRAIADLASQQT